MAEYDIVRILSKTQKHDQKMNMKCINKHTNT